MTYNNNAPLLKLSKTPQKAANEMIKIIQDISDIYVQENEILQDAKPQEFQSLQDVKMVHAKRYEQAVAQILSRQSEMKTVGAQTKAQLVKLQSDFAIIADRNRRLIERMQRAVNQLGSTIRDAASDAVSKRTSAGYGKDGGKNSSATRNMSIGINQTV